MLMMMALAQSAVISYVRITPSGHITRTTRNAAACHVSRVTNPASCNGGDGGSVECHGGMQAGKNEYLWNYDC